MTWQSGLPRVETMPARPCSVTPRKRCGWTAARTASIAIWTPPSVPFLKPTGIERPEASSRWTWLSVVRAPIAPQVTRSEVNCGVIGSRNSEPEQVEQEPTREAEALVDGEGAVEVRIVEEPLPADRRARLLEVDAHHDAEVAAELVGHRLQAVRVVEPGHRVVDGARADDDQQAVVLATQDANDLLAGAADDE